MMHLRVAVTVAFLAVAPSSAAAQQDTTWASDPPALEALVDFGRDQSDLRVALVRYGQDNAALRRRYDVPLSPVLRQRQRDFYSGWLARLRELDFDRLNHEGRVDYVLLRTRLEFELAMLDEEAQHAVEMAPLVPFDREIQELQERRRDRLDVDPQASARTLAALARQIDSLTSAIRGAGARDSGQYAAITPVIASRADTHLTGLLRTLSSWYTFYNGYDPLFTWWASAPYEKATAALEAYRSALRQEWLRQPPGATMTVVGEPIGVSGLRAHLAHEMIPYTPAELIAIAEAEFEFLEGELLRASRDMGYGDDWRAAQEAVKNLAVAPGDKPAVVRELARQSEAFLDERGSITIPPLAREIWRMEMMSPERQLTSPFFLGGEVITISYPTDEMAHEDKLMSMRGNNPHFNRATVHHELIPGHHLQGFMTSRFNEHRGMFGTPFWGEGWALYWELVLWDQQFPRGPEDRIGMLFWRMHRAARIIFSLSFHLNEMTPQEAVDFLVDRVGHERANAEAEVRRSFAGSYSPLYQVAYLIGGMQFRALRQELVETGRMTEREFHDTIIQGGRMPVEMVRARLMEVKLSRDYSTRWRFAGDPGR